MVSLSDILKCIFFWKNSVDFWHQKIDFESIILALFDELWLIDWFEKTKFLWVCWFLAKNIAF